jgi:hypothetical protein
MSMARKGNPCASAAAESLMKTLKNEEVYPWDYQTVENVKKRITHFREQGYNQKLLNQFLLAGR